jgi:hypothetical protein
MWKQRSFKFTKPQNAYKNTESQVKVSHQNYSYLQNTGIGLANPLAQG